MLPKLLLFAMCLGGVASGRANAEVPPTKKWMLSASGGSTSREGDRTRPYGSLSATRKLGKSYLRISATRFGSAVRQVDVTLPSTYTLGFVSAGTTFGHWFVDGYGSFGLQHYRAIRTDLGSRSIEGSQNSGVLGGGGDVGYLQWLSPTWSLTPSASVQYIRSKALREQIGPTGPSEYETRETGATFGGILRIDKYLGRDRADSVGLHLSHYVTTNASAALSSGTRGALSPTTQSGKQADGWTELGGSATLRITPNLYIDASAARTFGARSGNLTTTGLGARILF